MLEAAAPAVERSGSDPATSRPAVRLDAVTKSFGPRRVLDRVSFAVRPGSGFVILGRSGTGKSVTLKHIIGLVRPDEGRVFVDGDEISALDGVELSRVRTRIGFLFQNAALFDSISVGENVAFPMRRHTRLPDREIRERALGKLAEPSASAGSSTRCPRRSRAACASGRVWPARWRSTRRSCSSTSRAPASIPSRPRRSTTCSSG
jgi:ABC-type transporter Mla maintaining outer membrane lipid asymmetry ATPase subunit MlaF